MCGMPVHNGAMTSMIPPISTPVEADMFIEMLVRAKENRDSQWLTGTFVSAAIHQRHAQIDHI